MNNLKNSVRLIGHLGQTPEVKDLSNGKKLAKFSMAINESYKNDAVHQLFWLQPSLYLDSIYGC